MLRRPDLKDQDIGRRIRARRREAEISQDTVAQKLGVTVQRVADYEAGRRSVPKPELVMIAHLIRVDPDFLRNGERADA